MKVVFIITTKGHGKGGHFHSLNAVANSIGHKHDVNVINIGFQLSQTLDALNYKVNFLKYNGSNFINVYYKLKKIINTINPDAIHAFDVESFAFTRLLSARSRQPSHLNKCGGPNPKLYYPKADNLVLFSKENKRFFDTQKKYQKVNTVLISNRVLPVVTDKERVKAFREKHKLSNETTLLRIARIGHHYYTSILQGVNLVKWLVEQGYNVKFIILGTVQSKEVYSKVIGYIEKNNMSNHVIIENDDEFTHNASKLLTVGDIIIGTGRNFMEAASLNKILLVPYKDEDYPLLVNKDNFEQVFETNFSPRTKVDEYNLKYNLSAVKIPFPKK